MFTEMCDILLSETGRFGTFVVVVHASLSHSAAGHTVEQDFLAVPPNAALSFYLNPILYSAKI